MLILLIYGVSTLYLHVHIAKTGGTTLNGILANKYENVCGVKGYSYDFFNANLRAGSRTGQVRDSINKNFHGFDRTRVPLEIMDEIGYEDCHWLSNEVNFRWWSRFKNWHEPVEFHIPCRDPVDHFLSQVNHHNLNLN